MTTPDLSAIARPGGGFAMVAMDQRESLRTMFADAGAGAVGDETLIEFKTAVAETLGPLASGFLADPIFGFDRVRAALPPTTGLILAADALDQQPGEIVEDTALDDVAIGPDFDRDRVVALKLLIIWRRDDQRERRNRLAREFVIAAERLGLLSVLEPVVRATPAELEAGTWDPELAILECAEELSQVGQSLYKVQVPLAGKGDLAEQERASRELGAVIRGPWVVLSQGVSLDRFADAVLAACRGGASGFLAGRALWSDVVGTADVRAELRARSVPRLERLNEIVDREARPWSEA
jgi:sulfofructosephosphate aldolase